MGLPVLAPPEVRDVTLALFGGRKTDIAPSDCPEGLTPDEQDNIYLPGDVQSRPAVERYYAANALTGNASILYSKSYNQPNDQPLTLVLTSDGILWVEDITNNPRNPAQIGALPAGTYGHSVTEFGREYIAFSDLLHGQAIPLQYDGTHLDRVTMDGPGAPPQVGDEQISVNITASPNGLFPLSAPVTSGSEVGNLVTLNVNNANATLGQLFATAVANGVQIQITVSGAAIAGYNGTFTVTAANWQGGGVLLLSYICPTAGLAALGASGTVAYGIYQVVVTSASPVPFNLGVQATIAGAGVAGYNGTWTSIGQNNAGTQIYVVIPNTALAASGNGTISVAGSVSLGIHRVVLMWLTRQGYLSKPSTSFLYNSGGTKRAIFSNLAIGPANVVARVIGMTGAGGANFFIIPTTYTLPGTTTTVYSTVVPDNVSTQITIDVADNSLFAGIPIDQIGNDLFDQCVLGPVLGFFAFASRLVCWGDYNKVQNFVNMGFCGGYLLGTLTAPLGWNANGNAGGTLVNGGSWASGMAWQITGDGTANQKGLITQTAFQTSLGTAILQPNTQYSIRLWGKASAPNLAGTAFLTLSSVSAAFTATALFAANSLSTAGALTNFVAFSLALPNVIPADLLLSLYATNLPNGATVTLTELEMIFTANPYRDNLSRWSYVNNPEAFVLTTGNLGAADDAAPIRCFSLLRTSAVLGTGEGLHLFADNGQEPYTWQVNQLTRSVGVVSLRGLDAGKFGTGDGAEDWLIVGSTNGAYLFAGAEFWKISQEISRGSLPQSQDPRKTWDDVNMAVKQTIVVKNDPSTRRAYISVPINGVTTPNGIFVVDYRELDTAVQIAGAAPLHITLAGKMRSSDLTRKWSWWNVFANTLEILLQPGNARLLFFGGGPNAGGNAFGNLYSLNALKLTDDDYGQLAPYYTTYAFTDHEQEQALQLGSGRKLVKAIHAYCPGVGLVIVTPIVNSLYNFQPPLASRLLTKDTDQSNFLASDLEWTTAIHGQRIFFRVSVQPLPGATDVQYRLQKFIAYMMKDPVAVSRQSMV